MRTMNPFITIVTPCWNSVGTIERTIKSVLQQKITDYEYVIVDGGSTDGTIDIIKKYEPLFEGRMRWKSEPDKGIYDAFNKGIERATGKYVWIVNSDDWMEADALDIIKSKSQQVNDEQAVLAFSLNFVDEKGNLIRKQYSGTDYAKYYRQDYIGIMHPATIVPKVIYDKYGSYDIQFKIIGDADWYHRIYAKSVKFVTFRDTVTNMSQGGVSTQYDLKKESADRVKYLKKNYTNYFTRLTHYLLWLYHFYYCKYHQ